MFHTTELKSRYNHQIVFIERIGDSGIVLEPFQRSENLIENDRMLGHFLRIGFPVIHDYRFTVPAFCQLLPFPGYKRK